VPHPVTLTGPYITLRELTEDDTAALHAVYGDPATSEHLSFEPRTVEQTRAIIERVLTSATHTPRVDYTLAVCLTNTDSALIGTGRLALGAPDARGPSAGLDAHSTAAQFGLAIRADHWHHGHGTQTLTLLLGYAFHTLGIQQVWGARGPRNTASKALMDALGFTEAYTIPQHIIKNGVPRDSIIHVIHRHQWRAGQTK
jgi:ribosomal-protein-alanine N-acetyltransferase